MKMIKTAVLLILISLSVSLYADTLWDSAVTIYSKNRNIKSQPKSSYVLMESGAPGGKSSKNEIWEEYKYQSGKPYHKILKVMKNGMEQPLPEGAKDSWSPVKEKKKKKDGDYKGVSDIFYTSEQKNVSYKKTGKTKTVNGRTCVEYSYKFTKKRKGKTEIIPGKAYIDEETGAPCEIRRQNTSKYMKGSPDSFVMFSYDGKRLNPNHFLVIMNINFFGKKLDLKTECKFEY